jgi:membrane protease YdiL (CAAX protease family)
MPANDGRLLGIGLQDSRHAFLSVLFTFAVYGPVIAAFVATFLESGKAGIVDLIDRMAKWRVGSRWYLLAIGVAVIISLIPKLAGMALGLTDARLFAIGSVPLILAIFLRQFLTSGIGEEPGWRGYLQPYLQSRYETNKSIWILGIVWAAWHYPFTAYYTLSGISGAPLVQIVITVLMALVGQTISLVGMSHIYAWLYNNIKSVFLAILFYALSNVAPTVLLGEASQMLAILTAAMPWVVVFVLQKLYGKALFSREATA